jgi:putative DNA primase/helicase
MSHPSNGTPEIVRAWHRYSPDLAEWAQRCLVNRTDAYGRYKKKKNRDPNDSTKNVWTAKGEIPRNGLMCHFQGIDGWCSGLHSIAPDGMCRWVAWDIDAHDGDDKADPEANFKFALLVLSRLRTLGLNAILEDSNGKGGFHILVLFDGPVSSTTTYRLARGIVRDHAAHGLATVESFPKQAVLKGKGFGNWLRLVGPHHTSNHWSRIWDAEAATWLDGEYAIDALLKLQPNPVALIEQAAATMPDPGAAKKAGAKGRGPQGRRDRRSGGDAGSDAERIWSALEFFDPDDYDVWIKVGLSLTEMGPTGLQLWEEWSQRSHKFVQGECGKKWGGFDPAGRGIGSLIVEAKDKGWIDPRIGRPSARPSNGGPRPEGSTGEDPERQRPPEIFLAADEHRAIDETIDALRNAPEIYTRGPLLVRVRRSIKDRKGLKHTSGSPTIEIVPTPALRTLISRETCLLREVQTKEGSELVEAHPPDWLVKGVESAAEWPGFRELTGVVEAPTIRPDGTILSEPGYDEPTGLILASHTDFPAIPEKPTRDDARKAAGKLLAIISDFPFKGPEHQAVWLAAVLTVFARHAIDGPCPLFLFNANVRGAGKSKLCDSISILATGREMARSPYPDDDDELQKMLLSVALAGDRMMLFDNLSSGSSIGGPALDRTITSATLKGRILGMSKMTAELPNLAIFFATGNNVGAKGDALRRILIGRLESDQERPEERDDFTIQGDLLDHVRANRGELAVAAVTILRAHALAGWPAEKLTPMDFTAWCRVVRHAVHWATGFDPAATREEARENDQDSLELAILIGGIEVLCRAVGRNRLTANEIVKEVKRLADRFGDSSAYSHVSVEDVHSIERFRDAIVEWSPKGEVPTPQRLGIRLNKLKGRVCGGRLLVSVPDRDHIAHWGVRSVAGTAGIAGTSPNASRAGETERVDIYSHDTGNGCNGRYKPPQSPQSPHEVDSIGSTDWQVVGGTHLEIDDLPPANWGGERAREEF